MKRKMGKGLTILITMSMIVCGIPFPQGQTNEGKRADVVKAETKTAEIRTVNANLGAGKKYQIAGIHDAEHIADEDVKNPYVEWSNGRGSYVYYGNYYQSDRSGKKKDPIKWCVVDASTTEYGDYSMLLQSDAVLDNVVYINDYAKKLNYSVTESDGSSVFGTTYLKREKGQDTDHLANDYQYSDMRYWLNSMKNPDGTDAWEGESTEGGFLDTAFSSEEQLGLLDSKMVDALIHSAGKSSLKNILQTGIDKGLKFYGMNKNNYYEMIHFTRLFHLDELQQTEERDMRSGGYVIETIEAAVWCLITTDSLKECLLKVVNMGHDTDTVAAVAGGLAGLYYGVDAIPKDWLDEIVQKEYIEDLCVKASLL